jgi:hypothetical protein
VLKVSIVLAILLYLGLAATFFATQRSLLYYPSRRWVSLADAHANAAYRQIDVSTSDGIRLKAWYAPPTSQAFTVVFFHGNADALYNASEVGDRYIAAGYGFLATEYRGYSGLAGKPTEQGLYEDGRAYLKYLISQGIDAKHLVLLGQSLGTGVAIEMATEYRVGGLMLLSPFASIPRIAQVHFPIFPAGLLALDRYENAKKIGSVHAPVLIVNGTADDIVPPVQGKELFALANEPREFHSIPGRGHNDILDDFAPVSLDWLSRVCGAK